MKVALRMALILAPVLMAGGLIACGSGRDSSPSTSPTKAPTGSDSSPSTSPTKASSSGGIGSDQPTQVRLEVTIIDFAFEPQTINLMKNDTLTLQVTNNGDANHTLTIDGGGDTGFLGKGDSSAVQFKAQQTGTFTYYCQIHEKVRMSGTIVVQ